MMMYRRMFFTLLTTATLACSLHAATVWDFNGTVTPAGASVDLLKGDPAFVPTEGGQGLAPGAALEWADVPELRLSPGLEILCRFRLDELREDTQVLAMKDGEYILRVDWGTEGRHLSFFVRVEGSWEPRLRGPLVTAGTWYDVHAVWTGEAMTMEVNGEMFRSSRSGQIRPGESPLQTGPIAGVIDRLAIHNPGRERAAALEGISGKAEAPAVEKSVSLWGRIFGAGKDGAIESVVLGGKTGWEGWQGINGATCEVRNGDVTCTFPSSSAMLVSPPLACRLAPFPFVCLEIASVPPGVTGCLDFVTDAGTGSISFQPQTDGRPTVISGPQAGAWTGALRRMALSFSGGEGPVVIRQLALADRPIGPPSFYIRSLAPGRAKLRPGREETVIMGLMNVGGEAEKITSRLTVPKGVRIIGRTKRVFLSLGMDEFDMATWTVRVECPGTYTVRVEVSAKGAEPQTRDLDFVVEPWPDLPATDYVPRPQPAKTDYISLMHYCALWKEGSSWNSWNSIEPWPERRPAIGFYDEGTPEVADWHIKYALEHGINGFIYCWFRTNMEPKIAEKAGHAVYEGLYNARYRDMFTFTIMWENGCGKGVKDEADLVDNLLPYWIENLFNHPSYLKIDNQPVLFVWVPGRLIAQLGGPEGTRQAFEKMRARCRDAGFNGLRLIACMDAASGKLGQDIEAGGWDAVTGYGLRPEGMVTAGLDPAGLAYLDHRDRLSRYKQTWIDRDACTGRVPDIPNVVMGWDTRPWGRVKRGKNSYVAAPRAENFEAACRDAKELIDAKPKDRWDSKIAVFDNWTEFGEGHYLEPTTGTGFTFVDAIKHVFCTGWAPESVTDIIPEDLDMAPPQRRYEAARAGYGKRMPWQPIRLTGDLLARWEFESEEDGCFLDSSPNDCRLRSEGVSLEPGRGGRVLHCGDGGAVFPACAIFGHPLPDPFFHPGGITVALWCKPSEANQSDRWMLNSVGRPASSCQLGGYRLGFANGCPAWSIPLEGWGPSVHGPDPLPVNEWSHLAGTFDNHTIRLYVNGKEVGTIERRGFINPGASSIIIGAHNAKEERNRFRGQLDDVRIYRRVLSPDEIADLSGE